MGDVEEDAGEKTMELTKCGKFLVKPIAKNGVDV